MGLSYSDFTKTRTSQYSKTPRAYEQSELGLQIWSNIDECLSRSVDKTKRVQRVTMLCMDFYYFSWKTYERVFAKYTLKGCKKSAA